MEFPKPRILVIACNYCGYAGADLAGTMRLQYPPNALIIRVPCGGRISPAMVLEALRSGYDGVLLAICHPQDCHFMKGSELCTKRFAILKYLLTSLGLEPQRVRLEYISAAEGEKLAKVIREMTEELSKLGKSRLILAEYIKTM